MKKIVLNIVTILVLFSCTKNDDLATDDCDSIINELSKDLLAKTDELSSNPTRSSCEAYKASWISVYNKLKECGRSTTELDNIRPQVESLDCGIFSGGTGGGTGGGINTNGNLTFYITQSTGESVTVICGGQTKYISTYFSNGAPGCGTTNAANFTLPAGSYNYTASTSKQNWSGTIIVSSNSCKQQLLTLNATSTVGHLTVWSKNTTVGIITVKCGGQTKYITTKYSSPNCEASGCAIFDLPYGNYSIEGTAAGGAYWDPFPILINSPGQCYIVGLN